MLKDFDKFVSDFDLPDEVKQKLIDGANERADGLVAKNEELIGKLNATNKKVSQSQSAAEELQQLKTAMEQKELEDKQHYDQALQINTEKYTKEINSLSEKLAMMEQKEQDRVMSNSINDALTEMRVNPLHRDLVFTHFKQQASFDGDKVTVGDMSLSDAVKEWSNTDQGKAVTLAPESSGTGMQQSTQASGSGKKLSPLEQRAADINKRLGM